MRPLNPAIAFVNLLAVMPDTFVCVVADASTERIKSEIVEGLSPDHRVFSCREVLVPAANSASYPKTTGTFDHATLAPADATILRVGGNISAIVKAAPPGATFYFEPGVYRGVSITPKNGQTFIGAKGAVLNGSALLTNFRREGNYWVVDGQTQEGFRHATEMVAPGSRAMRAGYPETFFIDDEPLAPVDALGKLTADTFYFDYAADRIYFGTDPAGRKVEAGKLVRAIGGKARNITVENLVVEKYNSPVQSGAVDGGQNWTIRNNEVRLNYGVGVIALDNSKIVANYVHDNGQMGLGGSGKNILVEANEIAGNSFWSGINPGWEGGGFKFSDTEGLIVRDNCSHNNNGHGMWTDFDNVNALFDNNLVAHNAYSGISHEIGYDAVIRNNTLIRNGAEHFKEYGWLWGAQILIQNSSNVEVHGNRMDMTGANGISLVQQDRSADDHGPYFTKDNYIHDNIVVAHDNIGRLGGDADDGPAIFFNGGNVWKSNQYFMSDTNRFWWGDAYDFAKFKAVTGEDGTISPVNNNTSAWLTCKAEDTNRALTHDPDGASCLSSQR